MDNVVIALISIYVFLSADTVSMYFSKEVRAGAKDNYHQDIVSLPLDPETVLPALSPNINSNQS